MLNPVSTHIKLIERNNVLREVVSNVIICAKLTVDRFFRCQQIGDLNIQLFAALVAYKINFLISVFIATKIGIPANIRVIIINQF